MLWRPHSLLQCILNLCQFITNDNTKKKSEQRMRMQTRFISQAWAWFHQVNITNVQELQPSMDQKSVCDAKIQSATPDHSVLNAQLKYTKQHELPFMCHLSNRTLHRGMSLPRKPILLYPYIFCYPDICKGNCHLPVAPYTTFNAKGFEDS